ncbi:MAG: DUF3943 domain-containing protein [Myxococcales bacterium]|nr:DUF3943 domain-containing protein [Myxococcales bacterium]
MRSTRCSRGGGRCALGLALALLAGNARGDEAPAYRVFVYEKDPGTDYLRLSLEEVGILSAGVIEYFQNRSANVGDWDLAFSADSFQQKVGGQAIAFDANRFGTNWLTHPLAGWLYYGAARGNRLAPLGSLFVATVSSGVWEWLGEYREQVAINDLIATPLGGASLAEPLIQLGAWFERGPPSTGRAIAATLLAPTKRVHDWLDDATPLRAPVVPRGELEARTFIAVGPTWESHSSAVATDVTAGLRTHLFHGPSPYELGRESVWLDDANLTTMRAEATASNLGGLAGAGAARLVDARVATRVSFVGYYEKRVTAVAGRPRGHGLFVGAGTGFDYQWHTYQRAAEPVTDQIALVEVVGTTLENWHVVGPIRLRTQMALSMNFAGVTSLAVAARRSQRGVEGLPTVLSDQGYAHAIGGSMAPELALVTPIGRFFGEARLDVFRSLLDRDRYFDRYEPRVSALDERFSATAGVERTVAPNVELALKVSRTFRRSRLEEFTVTYGESAARIELAAKL